MNNAPLPALIIMSVVGSYLAFSGFMFLVRPASWGKNRWSLYYSSTFERDIGRPGIRLAVGFMGLGFMVFGVGTLESAWLGTSFFYRLFMLLIRYTWGPLVAFGGWCLAAPQRWNLPPEWSPISSGWQELIQDSRSIRIASRLLGVVLILVGIAAAAYFHYGPVFRVR